MGLQSCKLCNSCLQSKEECGAAGGCPCVCNDWRYCSDRCCDICCQMCVDVCSGLCSGDCSYTFCTLCLNLAQNCVSFFTTQQTETSAAQPTVEPSYGLLCDEEAGDENHRDFDSRREQELPAERQCVRACASACEFDNGPDNKPGLIAAEQKLSEQTGFPSPWSHP